MKKLLAKLLLGLGIISAVAMGEEVTPEPGATLKVWESKGPEFKWIEYVGQKFEEKYGVKVTAEAVAMTETTRRLEQDGPVGAGADVIVLPHDNMGQGIISGVLMPNFLTEDRIKSEFFDSAVQAVTGTDGQMYGFPLSIETYVLFYNKNLLPNGVKSFEELREWDKANKFTNKEANKFAFVWELVNLYYGHSFIATNGGYLFGNDGKDKNDLGVNNAGAIKGIENMITLKDMSVDNPSDISYDSMMGLFREEKIAAILNGPWAIEGLNKAGVNFGIQTIPTLNGGDLNPFSGVRMLGVSTYTQYPQAAQLFAEFATSDEMLMKRYEMTKQIPPVKKLAEKEEIATNPFVNPILEQAKKSTPMPSIPEMGLMWEPLSAALNDTYMGTATPKEALDRAANIIKEQMASQN